MGREELGPDLGRVPRPGWQIFFCRDPQMFIAHPPSPSVESLWYKKTVTGHPVVGNLGTETCMAHCFSTKDSS